MTNDTHAPRRAEIRDAMLARAAMRRRTRRLAHGSLTLACVLAVAVTGWITLGPPTGSPAPVAPEAAMVSESTGPGASHEIIPASTTSVLERAITDDELLDLLHEAGEQAGLGIIDGRAGLVRWNPEPEHDSPEPGASGTRGDSAFLAAS